MIRYVFAAFVGVLTVLLAVAMEPLLILLTGKTYFQRHPYPYDDDDLGEDLDHEIP